MNTLIEEISKEVKKLGKKLSVRILADSGASIDQGLDYPNWIQNKWIDRLITTMQSYETMYPYTSYLNLCRENGVEYYLEMCIRDRADEVQSLCKHFAENGVLGTATQIECFNHWNHLFNFYVFARTAYDNSVSMEEHFPRFSGIFGMGAPFIIDIIRKTEACLDGQVSIMQAGLYLMEHIDKEEIYQLFEAALAAAQTPAHRNNIRMLRMAFRYSDLEAQESYGQTGDEPYATLQKYNDPTGELYYMSTQFDSFQWNDPGYGITIPVDCPKSDFMPDHWYAFEKLSLIHIFKRFCVVFRFNRSFCGATSSI